MTSAVVVSRQRVRVIRDATVSGYRLLLVQADGQYYVGVVAAGFRYVESYDSLAEAYREWAHGVLDAICSRE